MKILIVRTFPDIIKSTSYNVQEIGLAKAYVEAGHDVDIVMYGGKEATHKVELAVSVGKIINLYYLKAFGILKNGFFPGLKKMAMDYDLVQVHEYDQVSSWLLYTGKKLRDKVIIYHGPYYSDFNKGYNLRCKIFDRIFLKIRNNPDCPCFTKSNAAADFLKTKGFKNVTAVGVGLDTELWDKDRRIGANEEAAEKTDGGFDVFNFFYVGKLEPRRNTLFLLDVVDRLLTKHDDINFILIGDGEEAYKKACLEKADKWIKANRIEYISKVTQSEMKHYYQKADCMLFPSNYEIFGMVLMEAIYFGLPVISSNNGGADTLFVNEVNGIIVDSNTVKISADADPVNNRRFDIDEWVEMAERMYADKELRTSIKRKLESDKERLSWSNISEKILTKIEH